MILIFTPHVDVPTTISFDAASRLAEVCERGGVPFRLVYGLRVSGVAFRWKVYWYDPPLIVYFGHGREDRLLGSYGGMVTVRDVELLRGRVTYTMACKSGRVLGRKVAEEGGVYFGSEDNMFAGFPEVDHDYMGDFIDTWLVIPISLISGLRTGEAYRRYIERCTYYVRLYERMIGEWDNADWYAEAMERNRDGYRLYGSGDVRVRVESRGLESVIGLFELWKFLRKAGSMFNVWFRWWVER